MAVTWTLTAGVEVRLTDNADWDVNFDLNGGGLRAVLDTDSPRVRGDVANNGYLGHSTYTATFVIDGTVSDCGFYYGSTISYQPAYCTALTPRILYSQQTGDMFEDSDVWNTARDGSGTAYAPTYADLLIMQTGHTISTITGHPICGGVYAESGSSWNVDHQLSLSGSCIVLGSHDISEPLIFRGDADVFFLEDSGDPLDKFYVLEEVEVRVLNQSEFEVNHELRVDGSIDFKDYGVEFGADADYISCAMTDDFDRGASSPYSIFVRAKWDSASDGTLFKIAGDSPSPEVSFVGRLNSGNLEFNEYNTVGYSLSSSFTPDTDRIYNILFVQDALGHKTIYIDFEEFASNTSGSPSAMDNDDYCHIGNNGLLDDYHHGRIYEFRVWNSAELDVDDLIGYVFNRTDFTDTPDVHLDFSEGTGTNLEDVSDNDNDGTITGGADWIDTSTWRSYRDTVIGERGLIESLTGRTRSLFCQGEITVESGHLVYYEIQKAGIGLISSRVVHTTYRTTAQDLAITPDTIDDLGITTVIIEKKLNDHSKATIGMRTKPEVNEYLLRQDTLSITREGYNRIKGKIMSASPDKAGLTKLVAYDPIFDMKKRVIPRWFHTKNMWSFHATNVVKEVSPDLHYMDLTDVVNEVWTPLVSCLLLNTVAKQLVSDTSSMEFIPVGNIGSTATYGAVYSPEMKGGDILRFSVLLQNMGTGGNDLDWKIYDMDIDSENYDTVIASGSIPNADIPTTGNPDWVIVSVADESGRVPCPKFIKLALGNASNNLSVRWHGLFGSLFGGSKTYEGTGGPTESNLEHYIYSKTIDTVSYDSSIQPAYEIECMGDWNIKVDVDKLTYGDDTASFPSDGPQPIFSNRTRQVNTTTWAVARITGFYDCYDFDSALTDVFNAWYRELIHQFRIDLSGDLFPYFIIEGKSPIDSAVEYIKKYDGTLFYEYDETEEYDFLNIETNTLIATWSSLTDEEKLKRTFAIGTDIKGVDPKNQRLLEIVIGNSMTKSKKEAMEQMYVETGDDIVVVTDYNDDIDDYKFSQKVDDDGGVSSSVDFGMKVLGYEKDGYKDLSVEILRHPIDITELFKTPNELIKIVDSEKGLSEVFKIKNIKEIFKNGTWGVSLNISDNEWREVDPESKVMNNLGALIGNRDENRWNPQYPQSKDGKVNFTDPYREPPTFKINAPLLEDNSPFTMALEIFQNYTNTAGDYWILLGSDNSNSSANTMQTSNEGEQIIVKASRHELGDGNIIIYANITEKDIVGEWDDFFLVKEIGFLKQTAKPTYTDTLDRRTCIYQPEGVIFGKKDDLVPEDHVYKPYVPFMYNTKLCLTITHRPTVPDNYLKYLWTMEL